MSEPDYENETVEQVVDCLRRNDPNMTHARIDVYNKGDESMMPLLLRC
jgi:hypothetical protein